MIRYNERNLAGQFSSLMAKQKLPDDVIVLRNEDADLLLRFRPINIVRHTEAGAHLLNSFRQTDPICVHAAIIKYDALEEAVGLYVGVLLGIDDIAPVTVEELSKGGDDALAVRPFNANGSLSYLRLISF